LRQATHRLLTVVGPGRQRQDRRDPRSVRRVDLVLQRQRSSWLIWRRLETWSHDEALAAALKLEIRSDNPLRTVIVAVSDNALAASARQLGAWNRRRASSKPAGRHRRSGSYLGSPSKLADRCQLGPNQTKTVSAIKLLGAIEVLQTAVPNIEFVGQPRVCTTCRRRVK
jgi:hypothetical protein